MPPESFLATKTTLPVSHTQEKPSPVPLLTNLCMCEEQILSTSVPNPVPVPALFMQASEISLKPTLMHPLRNSQKPASSAPLNYDSYPNHLCQSSDLRVASMSNSLICPSNTAFFPPSVLGDSFSEASTVIPPASANVTSTPKTCGPSRPLLTQDVLNSASFCVRTQSSPCRLHQDCPRSLRATTMNQRRATAQQILNRELTDDMKIELGFDTTNGADSSAFRWQRHNFRHPLLHVHAQQPENSPSEL